MKIYRQTTLGGPNAEAFRSALPKCWSKEVSTCVTEEASATSQDPWCRNLWEKSELAYQEDKESYDKIVKETPVCEDRPSPFITVVLAAGGLLAGTMLGKYLKSVL